LTPLPDPLIHHPQILHKPTPKPRSVGGLHEPFYYDTLAMARLVLLADLLRAGMGPAPNMLGVSVTVYLSGIVLNVCWNTM
jgi:hypothetical protein